MIETNAVHDMKKVYKYFAVSELFPIFAPAILEKTSGNALFDILHDRLTSIDLVKYGKFEIVFSRTSLGKYIGRTCPSHLVAKE